MASWALLITLAPFGTLCLHLRVRRRRTIALYGRAFGVPEDELKAGLALSLFSGLLRRFGQILMRGRARDCLPDYALIIHTSWTDFGRNVDSFGGNGCNDISIGVWEYLEYLQGLIYGSRLRPSGFRVARMR